MDATAAGEWNNWALLRSESRQVLSAKWLHSQHWTKGAGVEVSFFYSPGSPKAMHWRGVREMGVRKGLHRNGFGFRSHPKMLFSKWKGEPQLHVCIGIQPKGRYAKWPMGIQLRWYTNQSPVSWGRVTGVQRASYSENLCGLRSESALLFG